VVERSGLGWDDPAPFGPDRALGQALLTPTRIYVRQMLETIRTTGNVKALAHITGGGLTENIPRVLPDALAAEIDLGSFDLPPVFHWLQTQAALDDAEMLRTFNCGIGMVAIVPGAQADAVAASLGASGDAPWRLGRLVRRAKAPAVRYLGRLARVAR
jgi:phosphoribosylformylglycinamidine cyclo-ligase